MSQTISEKIRALRKSRGYTQEMLCAKLNMPTSTYSYKERNDSFEKNEISTICELFGCSYDTFVSDAPFNPLRLHSDSNPIEILQEPPIIFGYRPDTKPVYLTDNDADNLRRIRNLTDEQAEKLFEYLKKIENGEV